MVFKAPVPRDTFEVGHYGIAEPPATAKTLDISAIDLFLIPLLACDQYGTRLGYGGGYYDRLLEAASGFRCGFRF
jgi:5-formyltetrahydrofolate cyclo-ligase